MSLPTTFQQIGGKEHCNTGTRKTRVAAVSGHVGRNRQSRPESGKNSRVIPSTSDCVELTRLASGSGAFTYKSGGTLPHCSRLRPDSLFLLQQTNLDNLESNAGHTTSAASTTPHETSTRQVIGREIGQRNNSRERRGRGSTWR